MKKIIILLITLMVINVGFLSGCTDQQATDSNQNRIEDIIEEGTVTIEEMKTILSTRIKNDGNELLGIFTNMEEYNIPEDKDRIQILAEIGQNKANTYFDDIEKINLPSDFDIFMSRAKKVDI